jgi:acetylornithine deacetylase/succinyl-diaminopimelate desuccinylase-like protein
VQPVFKREGGSIPVVTYFQQELGVSSIMIGFGLPDDNLHAPNEKMTLSQFHKGIQTLIHFYGMLPDMM